VAAVFESFAAHRQIANMRRVVKLALPINNKEIPVALGDPSLVADNGSYPPSWHNRGMGVPATD